MAVMWSLIVSAFLLLLTLEPSTSSRIFPLSGNVHPLGHFNVTMNIGEPPRPYFLDIDTGSNLTWLECNYNHKSCNQVATLDQYCNMTYYDFTVASEPNLKSVPHPLYTPKRMNLRVPCEHSCCTELHEDVGNGNPQCHRTDQHPCHYSIGYVDGSSSEGILVNDKFSFDGRTDKKDFFFGCGYKQHPLKSSPVQVDGILGLGMGKVGFMKHLRSHGLITKNIIGHCMSIKAERTGYLRIGAFTRPDHGITWVSMTKIGSYYSPGKATLFFGGQRTSVHEMKVLFDSGSTYIIMPTQAYGALVSQVKDTLSKSLREVRDEKDLCWEGRKPFKTVDDVKAEFKPLALKFDELKRLDIPPENYLIVTKIGNVCLGIVSGSTVPELGDLCVIGDVMQDLPVIYNNDTGHLGWVPRKCNINDEHESAVNSRL